MTTHGAPPAYGEPTRSSPDAAVWRADEAPIETPEWIFRYGHARRALFALRLGVAPSIADDLSAIVEAALTAAEAKGAADERDRIVALLEDESTVRALTQKITLAHCAAHHCRNTAEAALAALRVLIAGDSKGGAT